jgi:hypothetical protein
MPTCSTLLHESLDPFLNAMSLLYSGIEHDMHSLLSGGGVLSAIELSLQSKYGVQLPPVDPSTGRLSKSVDN